MGDNKLKVLWKTKEHLYKWLIRIGVHEGDITIRSDPNKQNRAIVQYIYKGENYNITADKKTKYAANLHNIENLIHSRVLGIERGIETLEQAFAGYTALADHSKGYNYFEGCNNKDQIRVRFKTLAKKLHSDTGGNDDEFKAMKQQYEKLIRGD